MFLDELATQVFSFLCHQDPSRTFQPSGEPLAMCARCVGVYVDFLLALPIMVVAARLGRKLAMYLHGAFVLQVIPFGFHLIPHGYTLRTISGQLFALGVVYFLFRAIRYSKLHADKAENAQMYAGRWLMRYLLVTIQAVVLLQLLLCLPWRWIRTLINVLALAGLGVFVALAVVFLLSFVRYVIGRRLARLDL
ncbi:MAG: DUF2085 domain-containing protein [Planctomycetota bacterium]|jgi:uncharacterized membrane protein|nr:DUF2085 domain-containing protein [Planctomycetota bacterium]